MSSRDDYLDEFKTKLDEWNAEIHKLESNARQAQAEAKVEYDKQLEALRVMRDDAQTKFSEMQNTSAEAWDVMVQGTEKAWQAWSNAFENARSMFTSKD
jgi:HPt (histidine-containing phosphotransfer) domain-containing protein